MKRFLYFITAAAIALLATGCSDIGKDSKSDTSQITSDADSDIKDEELSSRDRTALNPDTEHIDDAMESLKKDEYKELNEYAAWVSQTFKIKVCVVISDDLNKKEPEKYAEDYYNDLYGDEAGILYLINYDTGEDFIYRNKAEKINFTDNEVLMLFTKTSPLLVTEKIHDAIKLFLEETEQQLPEYVIDRTSSLSEKETVSLNHKLKEAAGDRNICFILINNDVSKSTKEYANKALTSAYGDSSDSAVITINTNTADYYIALSGEYNDTYGSKSDSLEEKLKDCLPNPDDKNEDSKFNTEKALDAFISIIK